MCQPGRPRPQGASHRVSSPSFCAFQSAKSCGDSFSARGVVALALLHLLERAVRELAVLGEAPDAEVDVALGRVRVPRVDQVRISATIASIVPVAVGSRSGRPSPRASVSRT